MFDSHAFTVMTGGYDDGYEACSCFWGREPGSLVKLLVSQLGSMSGRLVLDAGCGEGKNAAFLADKGARIRAIDVSEVALKNARRVWGNKKSIEWEVADIRLVKLPELTFDVTIAYGVLHCLTSSKQISAVVAKLKRATKPGGFVLVCAFNDRLQDLRAHPNLNPCLVKHDFYLSLFHGWDLLQSSDTDLTEVHPHNMIEHTHSMTRLLARS